MRLWSPSALRIVTVLYGSNFLRGLRHVLGSALRAYGDVMLTTRHSVLPPARSHTTFKVYRLVHMLYQNASAMLLSQLGGLGG